MKFSHFTYGVCALAAMGLVGCGGIATTPVSGTVTMDGVPLKTGTVTYVPVTPADPPLPTSVGSIGEDGTYLLGTGEAVGAPVGSYKVTVRSTEPSDPSDPYSAPKSTIPDRYADPAATDLQVEVVNDASAGAYDLKLTK